MTDNPERYTARQLHIKTILRFNPATTALASGKFALMFDPTLDCFVVTQGVRKQKVIFQSGEFESALEEWLKKTKQSIPPF